MRISNYRTSLTTFFLAALFTANVWAALPPQAEADKLMIEAKTAAAAENFKVAVEKLARVAELRVRVPDTFSFHYGFALYKTGDFERAKQQLDRYITAAGSSGKFYKEALEAYAAAEAGQAKAAERTQRYLQDLARYAQKMKDCPGEYDKYEQSLKNEAERLGRECMNFDKYDCRQYHDDDAISRRADRLEKAMEEAARRADWDGHPRKDDWCRSRYGSEPTPPTE